MPFAPLTRDQYQKAIDAGFSPQQIVQNEQIRKSQAAPPPTTGFQPSNFNIPHLNTGSPAVDLPVNTAIGAVNMGKNALAGAASDVMQAGFGTASALTKLAGKAGLPGASDYAAQQEAANPITKVAAPFTKTLSGKVGEVAGEAALFASPTKLITGAKDVLTASKVIQKTPWIVQKLAQLAPEAAATGGVQYLKSGGDTKSAEGAGALAAGISAATHGVGGLIGKIIPKEAKDNVRQFVSYTGKILTKSAATDAKVNDALSAFTTMVKTNHETPMEVKTAEGATQKWDPKNTDLFELPQVWMQTAKNVYKKYSDIAAKASDEGAQWGQKDFVAAKKYLQDNYINNKSAAPSSIAKAKTFVSWLDRYGTKEEGKPTKFKPVSLSEIQDLVQNMNKDVARGEATAAHDVASGLTVQMRDMMDKKIENATGAEYQAARTEYAQLKSVEKDILNRYKKAMAKSGQFSSDLIDGLGAIDILQSVITGNAPLAARGLSILAVKGVLKYIRNPENAMRRAFAILEDGPGAVASTPLGKRFFQAGATAPTLGKAAVGTVTKPTK